MPGTAPFLLAVYDGREGRLLRIRECATEAALDEIALEERDHFARFPHVEIQIHLGLTRDQVLAQYEGRTARRLPVQGNGGASGNVRAARDSIVPRS